MVALKYHQLLRDTGECVAGPQYILGEHPSCNSSTVYCILILHVFQTIRTLPHKSLSVIALVLQRFVLDMC